MHTAQGKENAEFGKRNALYAMKYHVLLSTMYQKQSFRDILVEELRKLLRKSNSDRASEGTESTNLS